MEYRKLGRTGLQVSSIGMGCVTFGREIDEAASFEVMDRALERGITLFDTAEAYGPFINEQLLGEALAPYRTQVVIGTKFGFGINPDGSRYGLDSRPEHIRQVIDASLKRLGTDKIDLLYQHRVDPNEPIEDVTGSVKDLIGVGKVKYFGLSEASAHN